MYSIYYTPTQYTQYMGSKTGVYGKLEVVCLGICKTSDQFLVILPPHDYNLYFTCYFFLMSDALHILCSLNIVLVQQKYNTGNFK